MPRVTVTPIGNISVKVNPDNQKVVYGTSSFIGGSAVSQEQLNTAISLATTALQTANDAYDTANTKVSKSGDTMTGNLLFSNAATVVITTIDGGTFS